MQNNTPPEFWNILAAFLISTISGIISISNRVLAGQKASLLWVFSEFLTAILCGYLMNDAYPTISWMLPDWVTLALAISVSAYLGAKMFRGIEQQLVKRYTEALGGEAPKE